MIDDNICNCSKSDETGNPPCPIHSATDELPQLEPPIVRMFVSEDEDNA